MVYTPISSTPPVTDLVNQKINLVPPYEDSGVKYQGKFKTQKGIDTYELKTQVTRFNIFSASGIAAGGVSTSSRPRSDLKFYCTKMIFQWHTLSTHASNQYITLSDRNGTNDSLRFAFFPNIDDGNIVIDFSDCPRLFEGTDFSVTSTFLFPAGAFVVFSLYGWEEQV